MARLVPQYNHPILVSVHVQNGSLKEAVSGALGLHWVSNEVAGARWAPIPIAPTCLMALSLEPLGSDCSSLGAGLLDGRAVSSPLRLGLPEGRAVSPASALGFSEDRPVSPLRLGLFPPILLFQVLVSGEKRYPSQFPR